MKLVETRNGWWLQDIVIDRDFHKNELYVKNMQGRQTNPKYNPTHHVVLWIDDEDMARFLKDELLLNVVDVETEVRDENGDPVGVRVRKKLQLKAYPKMKPNRMTGKDEPSPRVMLKTPSTGKSVRLEIDKFGLFDTTNLVSADIKFHTWEYEQGKAVGSIDELWAIIDEASAVVNDKYILDKYGYSEDYDAPDEEVTWSNE